MVSMSSTKCCCCCCCYYFSAAAATTLLLLHQFVEGTAKGLIQEVTKKGAAPHVYGISWRDAENVSHESFAPLTVMCDGLWSNFRKKMTTAKPQALSHYVGALRCVALVG